MSDRPIELYFQQAATLRLNLQYNREDYEFAAAGGRIIYLMDANVVGFFMAPEKETDHVVAFGPADRVDYAAGTALITAEFLFSRELAGQGDSPALIAPAHGDDVSLMIDAMRREMGRFLEEPGEPFTFQHKRSLESLVNDVRSGKLKREEAVAELRQIVPGEAKVLMEGSWQRIKQLKRLYDEDLLRPLAVHPAATREILEPDPLRVAYWQKLIEGEREPKSDLERAKVRRDAEVLVQTLLLDETAVGDGANTRYVLVTADHKLFDAYARWYWQEIGEDRKFRRFIVRAPLQYAPILNMRDMPNGILSSDVFRAAENALDSLFANLSRIDRGYPHTLALHRILAKGGDTLHELLEGLFGFNPLRFDEHGLKQFRQVRENWHDSFRTGVLLNSELMQRRMRAEFAPLARLLREDVDLRSLIHDDQRRSLRQIEDAHVGFSTRLNLDLLMRWAESLEAGLAPRTLFLVRTRFAQFAGEAPLNGVLGLHMPSDRTRLEEIFWSLEASHGYDIFLFAACVAYRCERWAAACHYAERSLDLMPGFPAIEAEREEVCFLLALATRYALAAASRTTPPSSEGIERAFRLLERNVEFFEDAGDAFGSARASSEYVALVLVTLYHAHLLVGNSLTQLTVPVDEFAKHADRARTALRDARLVLQQVPKPAVEKDALAILETQIFANVISAALYARLLAPQSAVAASIMPKETVIFEAVVSLAPRLRSGNWPPVVVAEHLMLRYALGDLDCEGAVRELADLKRSAEQELRLDLDEAEFAYFEARLRSDLEREAAC